MAAPIIHRDQALGFRCGDKPKEYVTVDETIYDVKKQNSAGVPYIYNDGIEVVDTDPTNSSRSDLITRRYLRYIAANKESYYSLYYLSYTLGLTFQTVTYLAREMTIDKINNLPAV